jgi:endonuclease/exonuclease/phosphatase family metal-dependent hydrolase
MEIDCNTVLESGSFAPETAASSPASLRVVDWNIERGQRLDDVVDFLARADADLVLLQEVDVNARRTHRLNVAREIAQKLRMNFVFGCEFIELTQGSPLSTAYHGQATLSRWRFSNHRIIRFQRQSTFWRPRWFLPEIPPLQTRLGGRMALVTELDLGGRPLVAYNLHLESRGDTNLRRAQIAECLEDAKRFDGKTPIVLAGDLNLDVARGDTNSDFSHAEFENPFAAVHAPTAHGRMLEHGISIDWIFTRGPIIASQPQVHSATTASDHYPLSLVVDFVS